jgi:uncharacterized repeat protein (TIGR01451 family)
MVEVSNMREKTIRKNLEIIAVVILVSSASITITLSKNVRADAFANSLALSILSDPSVLVSATYSDTDSSGNRMVKVLSSQGIMSPTHGSDFLLISTGIAGALPVTSNSQNPGSEEGSWFSGGRDGYPIDTATLTMVLQVPDFMHYLYYDVQFFSGEYPEWIGTEYNDKLTIRVNSPSKGISEYMFDINSGYFVFDSNNIAGTGFDLFANENPSGVDTVSTTPAANRADAGASDLIPIGGETHPVSPNEQITVTISIKDCGDNIIDSAAFIDNFMFTGFKKTEIIARKTVEDLNGGDVEEGDILKYEIRIINTGEIDQTNNPGNEFEDVIPENTTFVTGSLSASSGTISYDSINDKIVWNGIVEAESGNLVLSFNVMVDNGLPNNAIVSNQGTVHWDSNEDGTNDALELTDLPQFDDGIDQDGDGETGDDDPTVVYVVAFEPPESITEDFSDDVSGEIATQSYLGRQWFETSEGLIGSVFEVVTGYKYLTENSFKIKLRSSGSPQYWNYSLSNLESDILWWEAWFKCGNASEASCLSVDFINSIGQEIVKLKFEYLKEGINPPTDWVLKLSYWDPIFGWTQLSTDYYGGYLFNSWYKIRIEKNGEDLINYSLYRKDKGLIDMKTSSILGPEFSDLTSVKFINSMIPVVCPMFFWDDHSIGLINL